MIQAQVTLLCSTGKYRPVSCLVDVESEQYFIDHKKEIQTKGIQKICIKRLWQSYHLKQYGYTKCKMRVYDKEKIEKENAERYERIKRERGWVKEEQ